MRISSMESLLTHKFKVPGFEPRGLWKERVPRGIVAGVYENRQNTIQTKIVKLTAPYHIYRPHLPYCRLKSTKPNKFGVLQQLNEINRKMEKTSAC